jgi:drug/metabolite transporter (DMT)-like permease
MTILLAVSAATGWGAADFFGGFSRRETPVFVLLAVSQLIGLVVLIPVLVAHDVPLPSDPRLLLACLAGIGVTLELRFVYFAISRGDSFITSAVGALGATLAVLVGLIGGDHLDLLIVTGMLCALIGGGLSAWRSRNHRGDHDQTSVLRAATVCAGGATGVSIALVSLRAAGRVDPYWATALVDLSTLAAAAIAAAAGQRRAVLRRLPHRAQLPTLGLGAATGVAGDLAYAAASHHGALSIVSALSSLYPLTTIALGITIQHQRPTRPQTLGIVLALIGAALLGTASH